MTLLVKVFTLWELYGRQPSTQDGQKENLKTLFIMLGGVTCIVAVNTLRLCYRLVVCCLWHRIWCIIFQRLSCQNLWMIQSMACSWTQPVVISSSAWILRRIFISLAAQRKCEYLESWKSGNVWDWSCLQFNLNFAKLL